MLIKVVENKTRGSKSNSQISKDNIYLFISLEIKKEQTKKNERSKSIFIQQPHPFVASYLSFVKGILYKGDTLSVVLIAPELNS